MPHLFIFFLLNDSSYRMNIVNTLYFVSVVNTLMKDFSGSILNEQEWFYLHLLTIFLVFWFKCDVGVVGTCQAYSIVMKQIQKTLV